MRFAPSLEEFSAMRPLVDLVDERLAKAQGLSLEQYRAAMALPPITQPRTAP